MPLKAGTAEGIILNYINEQNRPLNTQLIADSLQNHGIKKTTVQKVLDTFSDNGTISFKEYGKQKIYLAKQDQFEILSTEETDQLTKENTKMEQEIAARKANISDLEAEFHVMVMHLTDSQIEQRVKQLTDEITVMELKLSKLKAGIILVTAEEKKQVEETYTLMVNIWRKRKQMFKELWDMMTEVIPADSRKFQEELGIETDEDLGIKLEDHCNLAAKKQKLS